VEDGAAADDEQDRLIATVTFLQGADMAKIFLVVPDAPIESAAQLKSNRTLGPGIRLGLLDNSKGNADHLLNFIVEGVKKEFKVDSVVAKRKPASSGPATAQVLDELANEVDVVLSAMAD
jgi:hypothetical protein